MPWLLLISVFVKIRTDVKTRTFFEKISLDIHRFYYDHGFGYFVGSGRYPSSCSYEHEGCLQ